MLAFILRRAGYALIVALLVSASTFWLLYAVGDPAIALAGQSGTAADAQAMRELYGLDRPVPVQYLEWLGRTLRGDLGFSPFLNTGVSQIVMDRLPVTLALGTASLIVGLAVALVLGIVAAVNQGRMIDRAVLVFSVLGQATPNFWLALMLIVLFGVNLGWLPISGARDWTGYVLPSAVLGFFIMPSLMRLTRAGMIEVLSSDYIRTARAKGLPRRRIILRHALRNAALPIISIAAVQFGVLLSGSIVIESVFALDGIGRLAWESLKRNDVVVVQAVILIVSTIYIFLTAMIDVLNAWLDPRIREG